VVRDLAANQDPAGVLSVDLHPVGRGLLAMATSDFAEACGSAFSARRLAVSGQRRMAKSARHCASRAFGTPEFPFPVGPLPLCWITHRLGQRMQVTRHHCALTLFRRGNIDDLCHEGFDLWLELRV
jgi:hypothetical protein